jgi:hypothetical protein
MSTTAVWESIPVPASDRESGVGPGPAPLPHAATDSAKEASTNSRRRMAPPSGSSSDNGH